MIRVLLVSIAILLLYLAVIFTTLNQKGVNGAPPVPPESKGGVTLRELPPGVKPENNPANDPKKGNSKPGSMDKKEDMSKPENVPAMTEKIDAESLLFDKKWRLVHDYRQFKGSQQLTDKNPVITLADLKLKVPENKDKNKFHNFEVDGLWSIVNGDLSYTTGKYTALKVGRGENFEIEGMVSADGLGGWFILLGYDQGHGYLIYNVTLKTSGSPFFLCEFRGDKALDETDQELIRYAPAKQDLIWLNVNNKKLNLKMGKTQLVENMNLPNYHNGDVIFGTYSCQYGPKKLKIHTMRAKAK